MTRYMIVPTFQFKAMEKKIERLENALDKACAKIAWLSDDYETIESTWDVDDWKEWLLNNG